MTAISLRSRAVSDIAATMAKRFSIHPATLRAVMLLHLPRFADAAGQVDLQTVRLEAQHLAEDNLELESSLSQVTPLESIEIVSPRELRFTSVPAELGRLVCERLHYIRIGRSASYHWALTGSDDRIYAYCALSPLGFEARTLQLNQLFGLPAAQVHEVSRVYASMSAPRNAISYLLSRAIRELKEQSRIGALVTTVDPNLRFHGTSYLASNFQSAGVELEPPIYGYVNGAYTTWAQFYINYGTIVPKELTEILGESFKTSQATLMPRRVFVRGQILTNEVLGRNL